MRKTIINSPSDFRAQHLVKIYTHLSLSCNSVSYILAHLVHFEPSKNNFQHHLYCFNHTFTHGNNCHGRDTLHVYKRKQAFCHCFWYTTLRQPFFFCSLQVVLWTWPWIQNSTRKCRKHCSMNKRSQLALQLQKKIEITDPTVEKRGRGQKHTQK